MEIIRTQTEINEQLGQAWEFGARGSLYSGLSYEDGIVAMYEWLTEIGNPKPMQG